MDRIDLHVEVFPVPYEQLSEDRDSDSSSVIRERVIAARERQSKRYEEYAGLSGKDADAEPRPFIYCNAQMDSRMLNNCCRIDAEGEKKLRTAMDDLTLSARARERILKVSRTIADLAETEDIRMEHLTEAIGYRRLDKRDWGW